MSYKYSFLHPGNNSTNRGHNRKSIVTSFIYIEPYPKKRKYKYIVKHWFLDCWNVLRWSVFISIAILGITGALVYGAYALISPAKAELSTVTQATDFSYETTCYCYKEKENKSLGYTNYWFEMEDTSHCSFSFTSNNTQNDTVTFMIQSDDYNLYNIGDIASCWTNKECEEYYINKNNIPTKSNDSNYVEGAFLIFCIVIIFLCAGAWFVASCCVMMPELYNVWDYCRCRPCYALICGKEKDKYYKERWDKLKANEKLDYFVGFYSRKFGFEAGEDVNRVLLTFLEDTSKESEIELSIDEGDMVESESSSSSLQIPIHWPGKIKIKPNYQSDSDDYSENDSDSNSESNSGSDSENGNECQTESEYESEYESTIYIPEMEKSVPMCFKHKKTVSISTSY